MVGIRNVRLIQKTPQNGPLVSQVNEKTWKRWYKDEAKKISK